MCLRFACSRESSDANTDNRLPPSVSSKRGGASVDSGFLLRFERGFSDVHIVDEMCSLGFVLESVATGGRTYAQRSKKPTGSKRPVDIVKDTFLVGGKLCGSRR